MLRVLQIITGLGDGGAEAVLHRLVTTDHENRHEVISLTGRGKYGHKLIEAGIPVHVLSMPRGTLTSAGVRNLFRLIRDAQPDVVQTWMYHADLVGGVVAKVAGVRAIVWGLRNTYLGADSTSLRTRLVARCCACASHFVPRRIVSCSVKSAEVHAALGYARPIMTVIPNGYDVSRLAPDPAARQTLRSVWRIAEEMFLVGLVARWDPQKDHATWIASLASFQAEAGDHPWGAVLVGTGMDQSNHDLMGLIGRYGMENRILLLGQRADVPAIMSALDLHVLSSKGEAFPNVVAEAMACGTPGVVTDVGDAALVVGNTGWVVPACSPARLARAMGEAIRESADRGRWDRRKQAARRRIVDRFGLDRMVESYQQVWADAARSSE